MLDRRNFLVSCAGFAACSAFSPSSAWAAELSLDAYWNQLKNATSALTEKIVPAPGVRKMAEHLEASTAVWAPAPQTFSEQFDPKILIAPQAGTSGSTRRSGTFAYPTVLPGRSLAVAALPHLVHTGQNPAPETRLNVSEMHEFGNKKNPLLWMTCGCHVVRLPVSTNERRDLTQEDQDKFGQWVRAGGVSTTGESMGRSVQLLYVRELCRCDDGAPLIGFGFEDVPPQNQSLAANPPQFTRHAAFGVASNV